MVKIMKKWSIKNIIKEIIITAIMIFVISIIVNYIRKPDTYQELPKIKTLSINNKEIVFKTDNKPIVIHFWGIWCPTCKLEAPNINKIKDKINTITIAVNSGNNQEIQKFMKENKYNFTVINDNNGILAKKFNIQAYPTTLIYDKNGKLQFSEVGYSTQIGIESRVALIDN
jgi:thiol-disulfide isomerase/thioredoxin